MINTGNYHFDVCFELSFIILNQSSDFNSGSSYCTISFIDPGLTEEVIINETDIITAIH